MPKVLALTNAVVGVTDLEKSLGYYQGVLGLKVVDRVRDKVYLASVSGAEALVLEQAPAAQCKGLRFQLAPASDMKEVLGELVKRGIKAELRSDPHPQVAESVAFFDLNGFHVELTDQVHCSPPSLGSGIAPLRLGHIALVVPDAKLSSQYYGELLGFRVADWVGEFFVFMRCGPEHHTVNFLQAPATAVHHIAFEVRNSAHLNASCDQLAGVGIGIIWGPVRHGPGHNIATYHKNADGHLVELFTEMDVIRHEELGYYDPRPWHADRPQRPKVWSTGRPRDIWGPPPPENFLLGNL